MGGARNGIFNMLMICLGRGMGVINMFMGGWDAGSDLCLCHALSRSYLYNVMLR